MRRWCGCQLHQRASPGLEHIVELDRPHSVRQVQSGATPRENRVADRGPAAALLRSIDQLPGDERGTGWRGRQQIHGLCRLASGRPAIVKETSLNRKFLRLNKDEGVPL